MESDSRKPGSAHDVTAKSALHAPVLQAEIREQLERIRSSHSFRSSRNCLDFLGYVVEAALDGREDRLKERTLGIEVFGRDPSYDTNDDPVVRVTATQVRRRLAQYYQGPAEAGELRVELPTGSYQPRFLPVAEESHVRVEPVIQNRRRPRWLLAAAAGIVVIIAVLVVFLRWQNRSLESAVDQFWAPVLQGSSPALVSVGQPRAYNFTYPVEAIMQTTLPDVKGPPLPPEKAREKVTMTFGDILPMWDRYLALGDAICLSHVTSVIARHGREYHIRGVASTSFADLRENPAVLIGTFTNEWNLRITRELRFSFERQFGPGGACTYVSDRLNPSNRTWQICNEWPEWKMPVDYAIVSRVRDAMTGNYVVTAAGITQYGTAASGEFLSSSQDIALAFRQSPNWQKKNLQVVLSTRVIGGTAGPPSILAVHTW